MVEYWAERVIVTRFNTRADKMAVKRAGYMAVDWIDKVIGLMSDCLAEMIIVTRADLKAG